MSKLCIFLMLWDSLGGWVFFFAKLKQRAQLETARSGAAEP